MPAKDPAAYMRSYRARKRQGKVPTPSFGVSPVHLAALAEPPANDPDVSTVTVRVKDAQLLKLVGLVRAVKVRQGGAPATAPAAMRFALEVAHRALTAD